MSKVSVGQIFDSFTQMKVLVVGDVMVDCYIRGEVSRISPEAPVPVLKVNHKEYRLGGAANVARNVKALGATPVMCSILGDDPMATLFTELIAKEDIDSTGLIKSSHRITTVKNRVISGTQQLLRFDDEEDSSLREIDKKALIEHITQLMSECDLVIFEDYDKGCLDVDVIKATVQLARKEGKITAADPKKRNFNAYEGVSLFKPNLRELKEGMKLKEDLNELDQIGSHAKALYQQLGVDHLLVTLSEHGVLYQSGDQSATIPAQKRNISDVSGAGDTVISVAALALASGMEITEVAAMANLAGGIVCEYPGVVPVDKSRLMKELGKR